MMEMLVETVRVGWRGVGGGGALGFGGITCHARTDGQDGTEGA